MKKLTLLFTFLALAGFLFNTSTSRAQVFTETFDGTELDLSNWEISAPLDGSTVSQDDELLLMNDDTFGSFCNTDGLFGPGVGIALRHKLTGDFDIQVDFSGFAGIGVDWVQAFFNVFQDMENQLHIKRIQGPSANGIQTVALVNNSPNQNNVIGNNTSSGTLRIARSGSTITTYDNLGLNHTINGAFTGDVIVSLVLFVPLGGYTSNLAYDNFTINSGTLVEPPLTCPAQEVDIDIKPKRDPNKIFFKASVLDGEGCNNRRKLRVAILTTPEFNAQDVDPLTVMLGDPELAGTSSPIRSRLKDVDNDGDLDLRLVFFLCDLVNDGALDASTVELELTGLTSTGDAIIGSDSVQVIVVGGN